MKGDATMEKKSTIGECASSVCYEAMEAHARERIQCWLQELLEAEVTEFLGRARSVRRADLGEARAGYRNGYGKPRRISLRMGTVSVRGPRLRNLSERFESRVLPLFKRRSVEVGAMLPQLYLHGLSSGDFELALGGRARRCPRVRCQG
jgi:putative transposase